VTTKSPADASAGRDRPVVLIFIARLVLGIALFTGLYLDAREQPSSSHRYSVAGCIVRGGGFARVNRGRPPHLVVRVDGSGAHAEDADHPRRAQRRLPRDPAGWTDWNVNPYIYENYRGLWALTNRIDTQRLIIYPHSDNAPWDAPPEVRAAAATWLHHNGWVDADARTRLAAADFVRRTPIPGGWAHTIIALALLILAVALFPFRQLARLIAAPFTRRKPDPWLCESCGYDLRGLAAPVCPECGEPGAAPSFRPPPTSALSGGDGAGHSAEQP
jgi:hypothetical protein